MHDEAKRLAAIVEASNDAHDCLPRPFRRTLDGGT